MFLFVNKQTKKPENYWKWNCKLAVWIQLEPLEVKRKSGNAVERECLHSKYYFNLQYLSNFFFFNKCWFISWFLFWKGNAERQKIMSAYFQHAEKEKHDSIRGSTAWLMKQLIDDTKMCNSYEIRRKVRVKWPDDSSFHFPPHCSSSPWWRSLDYLSCQHPRPVFLLFTASYMSTYTLQLECRGVNEGLLCVYKP